MKKNDEESSLIDQGPCLYYFNLSYRRRLIRDIWLISFGTTALSLLVYFNTLHVQIIALIPVIGFPQAIYNFYKWRKVEGTSLFKGKTRSLEDQLKSEVFFKYLKFELFLYSKILIISSALALSILKVHKLYMSSLVDSFEKASTAFYFEDNQYLLFFFSVSAVILPVSIFFFKKVPKAEIKKMLSESERISGISGSASLKMILCSLVFFAGIGTFYLFYAFKNYSIFTKDHILISTLIPLQVNSYTYDQVDNIYQLKFFKTPLGKRKYYPHYVLEFKGGEQWSSKDNFKSSEKSEESNLLRFVLMLSGKQTTPRRYIEDKL